jgi:restriction system protein
VIFRAAPQIGGAEIIIYDMDKRERENEKYFIRLLVDFLFLPVSVLLFLVIGFINLFRISFWKNREKNKNLKLQIEAVDRMSGEEFEVYLADLFSDYGYKVYLTGASGDQGCDLILRRGGELVAVQAKRYRGYVGNDAVREAYAAKRHYNATAAVVVTNSYFSRQAYELSVTTGVYLIDRDELMNLIDG